MNRTGQGINFKLFLASALALSLTTVLFAGYTISTRTNDLEDNIALMAQTRAAFAAKDAALALYSEDREALNEQMERALTLTGTNGVMFLNHDANILAVSNGFIRPDTPIAEIISKNFAREELYYYTLPIYMPNIELFDYQSEFEQNRAQQAGWVIVAVDISHQREQLESIITTTLIIALVAFLAALSATFWLSRIIVTPIQSLTQTVLQLKEGNLATRAPLFSTLELDILSDGINRMAETLQEATRDLETRVEEATAQLHETLSDLQDKNDQLHIARENAEQANQSKSDFLARMSHELRTPLTSIQGFARLLNEAAINEADKQHCRVIDQAANQLLILIDDILDFSKLQSNTVVLENEPYNLIECVEQGVALFAQSAHEKGLELTLNFTPDLAALRRGDQKRLRQIINNLISNALKFTSTGGVFIDVSESPFDPDQLIIRVRDTGIGIRETNRNQLFRAFAQADTSISRQYGGTGLGLSITKSLIDVMGGSLTFESNLGIGTEFTAVFPAPGIHTAPASYNFGKQVLLYHACEEAYQSIGNLLHRIGCGCTAGRLDSPTDDDSREIVIHYLSSNDHLQPDFPQPLLAIRKAHPDSYLVALTPVTNLHNLLSQEELAELQPASFIPTPPTLTAMGRVIENALSGTKPDPLQKQPLLNGLNILIAEDNQFTCLLLETLAEKHGATFSTATNGHEAVKISQREPFNVILIDVHMPELNGIEAIKRIREGHGVNTDTPIIALTADLLQQEERELFEAGADEMLLKPFNENLLLEKIRYKAGITSAIQQNLEGLDSLVDETLFITELSTLAETAGTAITEEHWQQARDIIHQMLGITGVFNLAELDAKVVELHDTIKAQNYPLLPAQLNAITDILAKLSSDSGSAQEKTEHTAY